MRSFILEMPRSKCEIPQFMLQLQCFVLYNVRAVELGPTGTYPTVLGEQVVAVNVAEPFLSQGTLPAGKYVIMFKIGEYYVFYAPV